MAPLEGQEQYLVSSKVAHPTHHPVVVEEAVAGSCMRRRYEYAVVLFSCHENTYLIAKPDLYNNMVASVILRRRKENTFN